VCGICPAKLGARCNPNWRKGPTGPSARAAKWKTSSAMTAKTLSALSLGGVNVRFGANPASIWQFFREGKKVFFAAELSVHLNKINSLWVLKENIFLTIEVIENSPVALRQQPVFYGHYSLNKEKRTQ
jgi:hypothetical protein